MPQTFRFVSSHHGQPVTRVVSVDHLLYVRDGTLRVVAVDTGENQPVLSLVKAESFGYYGQVDYTHRYA